MAKRDLLSGGDSDPGGFITQLTLYLRASRVSQSVVEQWVMCTLCLDETAV